MTVYVAVDLMRVSKRLAEIARPPRRQDNDQRNAGSAGSKKTFPGLQSLSETTAPCCVSSVSPQAGEGAQRLSRSTMA